MKYDWILFDADETLFHFDAFKGMQLMFARKGVEFTEQDFHQYQEVNKPLWVDYQNGDITAAQLKHTRFAGWAEKLDTTTAEPQQCIFASHGGYLHFATGSNGADAGATR